MDPKQTAPQGGQPSGQEGQANQPQTLGANPVFGGATGAPFASTGGAVLSTGANISQTMDSLNSRNQSANANTLFQRKQVDNVDPVTGDIIISSHPDGKKPSGGGVDKAALIKVGIAILIIGAIALVVGIVFAFMSGGDKKSSNNGGSNSTVVSSDASVDESFIGFANYALFGKVSTNKIIDVSIANQYTFKELLNKKNEESKTFFNSFKQNYDTFANKYNASDLASKSQYLNTMIPYYGHLVDFVYNYAMAGKTDRTTLIPIFIEEGASGLDSYFLENYSPFDETDFSLSKDYYKYQKVAVDYHKKYLEAAKKANCIKDGAIIDSCKARLSSDEYDAYVDAMNDSSTITETVVNGIINNIVSIQTEIASPGTVTNEEVTVDSKGIAPTDINVSQDRSRTNE